MAVAGEGDLEDAILVLVQGAADAGGQVPDPNHPVAARGDQAAAVGGEGTVLHLVLVPYQRGRLAALHVPDASQAVPVGGGPGGLRPARRSWR